MIHYIIPFLIPKFNFPTSYNSNGIKPFMNYNQFEYNLYWEKINYNQGINLKHFDNILSTKKKESYMELLKINGIPALIIIIDKDVSNNRYIKEFIFNKSLILMLDVGPLIRISFYKKFKKIDFKNALNKNVFIII